MQFGVWNFIADVFSGWKDTASNFIDVEADPAKAVQLLTDWESEYGLPDPCTPASPTLQQRHSALLAKITASGGQSPAYYESVAAAMGYTIAIVEYRLFQPPMTIPALLPALGFQFIWDVHVPALTVRPFLVGADVVPSPLWWSPGSEMECRLRSIAPADTQVRFFYGS